MARKENDYRRRMVMDDEWLGRRMVRAADRQDGGKVWDGGYRHIFPT